MTDAAGKKRPRADLLASLDAAFAVKKDAPTSKYTAQAAAKEAEANSQQAYLHTKRKKKSGKAQQNGNNSSSSNQKPSNQQQQQQQHEKGGNQSGDKKANGGGKSDNNARQQQQPSDPLYGKLNVDILRVGLKNCSLLPQAKTLNKPYVLSATLKSYLEMVNQGSNAGAASDKLKNKVLQLDNPIKTTDVKKNALNYAQAQSAKLLSARQRRKLGLHLVKGEMKFSDAEQLCAIWRRYARDVIGTDTDDPADEIARNARAQSKFKTLDLSGCPVEGKFKNLNLVRSRNPCTIGSSGIIIAEKQQVLQICTPANKVISEDLFASKCCFYYWEFHVLTPCECLFSTALPKQGARFRVALDDRRAVLIEGEWLLQRAK